MAQQNKTISLRQAAVLLGVTVDSLRLAKARNPPAFPKSQGRQGKDGAMYSKAEFLAWDEKRRAGKTSGLCNELAQAFIRTQPHCGTPFRG